MANNTTLNTGSGGDVIATDDVSGVKYQRVKLADGTEDSTTAIAAGGGVEANALRVTLATDSTGVVSVDDNGGSLTVDGTVELGSTSLAALESLTTITTVSTVTNVATIGTSITPGTSAAHLGKAEDAAHTSGDTGVMALAVRRDADTTLVDTTGDYAPLQVNAAGSLKVAITSGAGSGGTSIADGASFTRDTTSVTPVGAVVETSAPTLTNGDAAALSMTTGGALRVAVSSGGVSGVVDDAAVTPGTTEGVAIMATFDDTSPDSVDEGDGGMIRMSSNRNLYVRIRDNAGNERGLNIDTNGALAAVVTGAAAADAAASGNPVLTAGRASTATPSAMSADGDVVSAWMTRNGATVVDGALVDDAAFTPGTSRVQAIGLQADEAATDSVDEGDIGAPRMTLDRKQIVTLYAHAAAGGATPYQNLDVDESEDDIKTSAGKLFWVHAINLSATKKYLKFYNATAASVTVGSTTPVLTLPLPTMADTNGAGFTINFGDIGVQFDTAISLAATTGFAVADTGAPGANEVIVNVGYT